MTTQQPLARQIAPAKQATQSSDPETNDASIQYQLEFTTTEELQKSLAGLQLLEQHGSFQRLHDGGQKARLYRSHIQAEFDCRAANGCDPHVADLAVSASHQTSAAPQLGTIAKDTAGACLMFAGLMYYYTATQGPAWALR